jgi:hypothetical protein
LDTGLILVFWVDSWILGSFFEIVLAIGALPARTSATSLGRLAVAHAQCGSLR